MPAKQATCFDMSLSATVAAAQPRAPPIVLGQANHR